MEDNKPVSEVSTNKQDNESNIKKNVNQKKKIYTIPPIPMPATSINFQLNYSFYIGHFNQHSVWIIDPKQGVDAFRIC
jgi:hypothetical protein